MNPDEDRTIKAWQAKRDDLVAQLFRCDDPEREEKLRVSIYGLRVEIVQRRKWLEKAAGIVR